MRRDDRHLLYLWAFDVLFLWGILVYSCACTEQRGPFVQISAPGVTASDRESIEAGGAVWTPLGFAFERPSVTRRDCTHDWYTVDDTECALRVSVEQRVGLRDATGADGLADRAGRVVLLDARWHGYALIALGAHELGHILLDTGDHLSPDEPGVMSAHAGAWTPTDADWALACRTIGACVGGGAP